MYVAGEAELSSLSSSIPRDSFLWKDLVDLVYSKFVIVHEASSNCSILIYAVYAFDYVFFKVGLSSWHSIHKR